VVGESRFLAEQLRATATVEDETERLIHKVLRRIIPFCVLCYLLNYVDRANIAIAKSSMMATVQGFTDNVYAIGVAVFFLPYCLFELPSNLIQHRVGARRWIARIMITWGIVSTCFMFTQGPWSYYILRLLLGLAEAGCFPGVLLYLSYWVPHRHRARAAALFFLSQAIAQVLVNTLGGSLLALADYFHLPGHAWQWLFFIEGVPSIIVGVIVLYYLTDKPEDAHWLSSEERSRLVDIMAREKRQVAGHSASDFRQALASPLTWVLSLIYGLMVWGYFPVNFFTPDILKNALVQGNVISVATPGSAAAAPTPEYVVSLYLGLLSAIPFGAAALTMLAIARHSDRRNERKLHTAAACGLMALGLALAAVAPRLAGGTIGTILTVAGLSLTAIGWFAAFAVFWAIPPQLLTGTAIAASLAIINALGNLVGNFLNPNLRVWFALNRPAFLLVAAGCALMAAVLLPLLRLPKRDQASAMGSPNLAES
jgi:ACS family tartrate transporter-like MFS transporter